MMTSVTSGGMSASSKDRRIICIPGASVDPEVDGTRQGRMNQVVTSHLEYTWHFHQQAEHHGEKRLCWP